MKGCWPASPKGLGIEPQWGAITPYEEELADKAFREEIGTDAYVEMLDAPPSDATSVSASFTGRGGTVRADIRLEGPQLDLIREVLISGDFFVTPPRVIFDLEARLRGLEVRCRAQGGGRLFRAHAGRLPQPRARRHPPRHRDGAEHARRARRGKLTRAGAQAAAKNRAGTGLWLPFCGAKATCARPDCLEAQAGGTLLVAEATPPRRTFQ